MEQEERPTSSGIAVLPHRREGRVQIVIPDGEEKFVGWCFTLPNDKFQLSAIITGSERKIYER